MTRKELERIAQTIIDTNIYLTLGTTDGSRPWVAPLYYCRSRKNHFYVISQPQSRHVRHIRQNPHVSFAIFDSHAAEGSGNGIQGYGIMGECTGLALKNALKQYHTDFIPCTAEAFSTGPYRLYKIIPRTMYVLDPEAPTDKRVRIF